MVLYSAIKVLSVLCSIHFLKKLLTAVFSDCQWAWDLCFLLVSFFIFSFFSLFSFFNNSFLKIKYSWNYLFGVPFVPTGKWISVPYDLCFNNNLLNQPWPCSGRMKNIRGFPNCMATKVTVFKHLVSILCLGMTFAKVLWESPISSEVLTLK